MILLQNSNAIWIPFLSAVCGGILVIAGQGLDRIFKRRQEKGNTLREIYAFCRKLEALMKNNYRELAMVKVHVEYWWYCSQSSIATPRDYEEHMRSQALAREIERKIGEDKANFIGHVRKFQAVQKIDSWIEQQLEIISDLNNKKAKRYSADLNYNHLRDELVEIDEAELRNIYYENLIPFKKINAYLETKLIFDEDIDD